MITMDGMASLNLVKQELDVTLKEAETSLRVFMEEPVSKQAQLSAFLEQIHQLAGIFKVINLDGVAFFVQNIEQLGYLILDSLEPHHELHHDREAFLSVLGQSVVILSHYLGYAHLRQKNLPVLLVPVINEIRRATGEGLVTELDFIHLELPDHALSEVPLVDSVEVVSPAEIPQKCRRLRHMYQVGLIGILRNENSQANLKIMMRSLERIARITGDVPLAQFWWISLGCLEAFLCDVELNAARKLILRKIDSQLKRLVTEGAAYLNESIQPELLREYLYIVSLASQGDHYVKDIKETFNLKTSGLTDAQLRAERALMNGPGGTVISTVADNIREEIVQIKESMDLGVRGMTLEPGHFAQIARSLERTASTLMILGLTKASQLLKEQAFKLQEWDEKWDESGKNPDEDDYMVVADSLLYAENAVAEFRQSYVRTAGADGAPKPADESAKQTLVSVSQLEEARVLTIGESRTGLSMTKKAIVGYIEASGSTEHLSNVPTTLHAIWGGLLFLQLERAANIIKSCEVYVSERLLAHHSSLPPGHDLETLADAITGIDYYLESMEEGKPIGEGVLEVSEESLAELGVSVLSAA